MSNTQMHKFVKELFNSTEDLGTLTLKIIRQKYLEHTGLLSLEKEEKVQLKSVVTDLALEYQNRTEEGNCQDEEEEEPSSVKNAGQSKRKHASSADSQEEKSPSKPSAKRKKLKVNGNNTASASPANKLKSKIQPNTSKSPKSLKRKTPVKTGSPRKSPKKKQPKARKRLSSGDVRDAVLQDDVDKADSTINYSSSSASDSEDNTEDNLPSSVKKIKKRNKSPAVFDPSSASEYGSPFKAGTPVVKRRKSKKSKQIVESDDDQSDSSDFKQHETSKFKTEHVILKVDKGEGVKKEEITEQPDDCVGSDDGELNVSDQKAVTVSFSFEGERTSFSEDVKESDDDTDSELGDTPLVKKKNKYKKRLTSLAATKKNTESKKRKRVELGSSDTDSELDDKPLKKRNVTSAKKKTSHVVNTSKKLFKSEKTGSEESDSDIELDKPLKKKVTVSSNKRKSQSKSIKSPKSSFSSDSDLSDIDTPLKSTKSSISSDSDLSDIDTPLKSTKSSISSDSDLSDIDTPLKSTKSSISSDSDLSDIDTPLKSTKSSNQSEDPSGRNVSGEESSSNITGVPNVITGTENSDDNDENRSLSDVKTKDKKIEEEDSSDSSVNDSGDEAKPDVNYNNNQAGKKEITSKSKPTVNDEDTSDTSCNNSESDSEKKEKSKPKQRQKTKKKTNKKSETKDDSEQSKTANDNEENNLNKAKPVKKTAENKDPTKTSNVLRLEKIARYIQVMPVGKQYTLFFEGCDTARKREKKLKELLVKAGMEGNPSMDKADAVKLKKEAAQLDSGNILKDSGRGKRRNVFSAFSSKGYVPPSPAKPIKVCTPIKQKFAGLKGIIDSEGSDSD